MTDNNQIKVFLPEPKKVVEKPDYYQIQWQLIDKQSEQYISQTRNSGTYLYFVSKTESVKDINSGYPENFGIRDYTYVKDELDLDYLNEVFQKYKSADRIMYFVGLNSPDTNDINAINQYQKQQCSNILNLVKFLYANSITAPIWIVTRGCQTIDNELNSDAIASSCLWGLGNAIAIEHPELWGGIVDLGDKQNDGENENLFKIIASEENKEDRFILREDNIYVPRLQKQKRLTTNKTLKINSEGAYLITGGLGSLGLKIAQWLAEKGAKNFR